MPAGHARPTHAYVPGRTPRHPEGTFDHIRATAKAGMAPIELAGCSAFRTGLDYIEDGYFWEAHEVLEPVWMALPDPSPERGLVQCLIQLANGLLKIEMGRPKAALRLAGIAHGFVQQYSVERMMTVDLGDLRARIARLETLAKDAL